MLSGSTAIITGAGRGLGRELSIHLAGLGAAIVAADVDFTAAKETAGAIEASGSDALPVEMDVSRRDAVEAGVEMAEREMGGYDILINNAGVDVTAPVTSISPEQWSSVLSVNLTGPFLLSRLAFEHMSGGSRPGRIVNIVSTAAKRAWANASAYHASKWGLLGLSHALHVEGRQAGVVVTAVVAGGMRTPFILDRFPDTDLGNLQEPSAVAQAVGFVLTCPAGTVVPELTVLPTHETSWP